MTRVATTMNQTIESTSRKPLRLWPGVIAAGLVVLLWFVIPVVFPDVALTAIFGALGSAAAIVVWWLFFSRAPWSERVGAILLAIIALLATRRVVHPSIAGGMMGMMLPIYAVPVLSVALVAAALVSRRFSNGLRRATIALAILVTCGAFTLIRTDGIIGVRSDLHWRWTPTPEERLLVQTANESDPTPPPPPLEIQKPPLTAEAGSTSRPTARAEKVEMAAPSAAETKAGPAMSERAVRRVEWSGFRGSGRDSIIRGVHLESDWSKRAPVELWRRAIGPGWSSFAVTGNFVYTQEQRGDDEVVSCYDLTTGAPVWRHRDAARFWESNAGPGPRGTPTVSDGRVYTLGATGIVNALDARSGAVVWSRDAASDTGARLPDWGFAGSPVVTNDLVIVATAGRLAAYDLVTGSPRWSAQTGGSGYSSPQLATIDGVAQILLLNTSGAASFAPDDGKLLWKHEWNSDGIVQPAVIAESDILIGSGSGGAAVGMRRIAVADGPQGWRVEERWTTNGLKPYFNDFVVHKGHAFGFDGSILAAIDLKDGQRKWKGGRYGSGQMLLLADQDLLLVISEDGELALVSATPDKFTEVAGFPALNAKTWNHPVVVGDVLLVRNGEEMVAFRLPLAGS